MVAASNRVFDSNSDNATVEPLLSHWRKVDRFSTVEPAEQRVAALREQGVEAVLCMLDGLCVLARRD